MKLVKIFDVVAEKRGYEARLTLAKTTGISKAAASQIDDKPEILKKMRDEASNILGENIDKYL